MIFSLAIAVCCPACGERYPTIDPRDSAPEDAIVIRRALQGSGFLHGRFTDTDLVMLHPLEYETSIQFEIDNRDSRIFTPDWPTIPDELWIKLRKAVEVAPDLAAFENDSGPFISAKYLMGKGFRSEDVDSPLHPWYRLYTAYPDVEVFTDAYISPPVISDDRRLALMAIIFRSWDPKGRRMFPASKTAWIVALERTDHQWIAYQWYHLAIMFKLYD